MRFKESKLKKIESPEAPFLKEFFYRLEKARIKYCVLRNYETLPYSLNGSDLDILVDRKDRDVALRLIDEFAGLQNGLCITKYKVAASVLRYCGHNLAWWGFPVDVFSTLDWMSYEYFPVAEMLKNLDHHNGIAVSSLGDAYLTAFIKEVLANGKDRKNYACKARNFYLKDKSYYDGILRNYYGPKVAEMWAKAIIGDEGDFSLKDISKKAKRALFIKAIKVLDWKIVTDKIVCTYQRYSRLFAKPGFSVAVLGTDGSGKSTIINGIIPVLGKALHNSVCYEHMRPNLLPSIARLFGRPEKEGPVTDPHGSKTSGFFGSFLRLSYYSLDYILGYWLKVYPALVKRPTLYIFDRYFQDYYIDPRRGRISLPKWLIKLYEIFIPTPDIILCLGTDAEVMYARKPEVPLEEVERQVKELQAFCKSNKRTVWIDTGCSIGDSVDKALEAITSRMAARYAK